MMARTGEWKQARGKEPRTTKVSGYIDKLVYRQHHEACCLLLSRPFAQMWRGGVS